MSTSNWSGQHPKAGRNIQQRGKSSVNFHAALCLVIIYKSLHNFTVKREKVKREGNCGKIDSVYSITLCLENKHENLTACVVLKVFYCLYLSLYPAVVAWR